MHMYSSQSTCVQMDWSAIELSFIPIHSNHMWIEVDTHASKQCWNECLASFGIIVHWRIRSSLQVELYMQVELVVSRYSLHDEQQPLYI